MDSNKSKVPSRQRTRPRIITSTPNNEVQSDYANSLKSPDRDITPSSVDERLTSIMKEIKLLGSTWNSEFFQSCTTFMALSTQLIRFGRDKPALESFHFAYEINSLVYSGMLEEARSLCQGELFETKFDELNNHLSRLEKHHNELNNLIRKLMSLHKIYQTFDSAQDSTSRMHRISDVILWESLIAETRGLADRLERDLRFRRHLQTSFVIYYVKGVDVLQLVSLWRHLGSVVLWKPVLEMIEHLLEPMNSFIRSHVSYFSTNFSTSDLNL